MNKTQNTKQTILLFIVTILILILTSCNYSNNEQEVNSIEVEYDISSMLSMLSDVIQTGSTSNYSNVTMEFSEQDITEISEEPRYYGFSNSFYIQTADYMYRFQLDKNYNVISYIKYRLEG